MDIEILSASSALDFMLNWAGAFWHSLSDTSIFLVFGLLSAGVLHVLVPSKIILWALGQGGFKGALKGALLGVPLPLCSCSVLPTSLALRRQGASLSAMTAFTISTPETSIDALAMTLALLPLGFVGIRPAASLLLAIAVGYGVDLFCRSIKDDIRRDVLFFNQLKDLNTSSSSGKVRGLSDAICRVCGLTTPKEHSHHLGSKLVAVFKYSFGTFFNDIAVWLVFGLLIAAFLEVVIPDDFFKQGLFGQSRQLQVFLAILFGIPIYTCATATTPMVATLLLKGLSPGAGLAFLLAGPATNIGSFYVFKKELGSKVTFAYYFILILFCLLMGVLLNVFDSLLVSQDWYASLMTPKDLSAAHSHSSGYSSGFFHIVQMGAAWIVLFLCLRATWNEVRSRVFNQGHSHSHSHSHGEDDHDCCE